MTTFLQTGNRIDDDKNEKYSICYECENTLNTTGLDEDQTEEYQNYQDVSGLYICKESKKYSNF